jgi:serine/threonine protein kinase
VIASDSSVAQYRIESLIGVGGMGEVYKAVDGRLGRAVALKVLPPELSHSRERIRRFLQEAKAASSLNHPNILTVYDAGEADVDSQRVHFIATELVVGSTLHELIHRDKVPLKRIVGYLSQAADGVAKAHAAGIVHRDLKPDNIMVTADGFAKVLDFGLAKLIEPRDEHSTIADATREGLILGTVAYMSPEQAQGKPVDHRSDIFAFGAILYEAAAGRAPFSGGSDPDILHRIIHEDPPPLRKVPADLDRVITRAMAKDPDERLQSMKDLALELRDISRSFENLKLTSGVRRRRPIRSGVWPVIAIAALLLGLAGSRFLFRTQTNHEPIRFAIAPPEKTVFTTLANSAATTQFAVSPNGKSIVFVASAPGSKPQIWVRDLASIETRALAGTEGAFFPFWSPDSTSIGFFAEEKLKRIAVNGGAPIVLADAPNPRGGSWSSTGVIIFAPGGAALARVPAAGGDATEAIALNRSIGELYQRWPFFLPDGKRFLYASTGAGAKRAIYLGELGSNDTHFLVSSESQAAYAGNSTIVFMRKGSLYSQQIDERSLRAVGDATLIEHEIGFAPAIRFGAFSASESGVLAYTPWVNPNRRLTWFDRRGKTLGTVFEPADWGISSVTLNGTKAVLTRNDPNTANLDLWMIDVDRGVGSRLTSDESDDNHPVLSPDGTAVAFTSTRSGTEELYVKSLSDQREEMIPTGTRGPRPTSWTRDGRFIVFFDHPSGDSDLWLQPMAPRGPARRFLSTKFIEWIGNVSPNGKWIAHASDDTGHDEIYVQPFPSGGDRYRVSTNGAITPKWSPDGRELFFMTFSGEIASVHVRRDDTQFECTVPGALFRVPGLLGLIPTFQIDYAVAADGRFLIVVTPTETGSRSIDVAINWRRE